MAAYGEDRCADCGVVLFERVDVCDCTDRRCEPCWWRHQLAAWRNKDTVAPIALSHIEANYRLLEHQNPKIRARSEAFFARHGGWAA